MGDELRLVSTDFDGTIHEEHAEVPIPLVFQERIATLQARGVRWVINTGREMQSLMETLGRSGATVRPDYLVLVEREIFVNDRGHYVPVEPWNTHCHQDHARLFASMAESVPDLLEGLQSRHDAMFYDDPWSPLCAIARSIEQMDRIEAELLEFAASINDLPMLLPRHARHLVVPTNGMLSVKEQVARHGGILSTERAGHAVAAALVPWL